MEMNPMTPRMHPNPSPRMAQSRRLRLGAASGPSPRMPRTRGFHGIPRPRSSGLGLVEALATLAVIAGLLGGLVVTSNALRTGSATRQTALVLRQLHRALVRYEADHGRTLPGPTGKALLTLLHDPATRPLLDKLVYSLDAQGLPVVNDGSNHPIRYFAPEEHPPQGPDFVSAGSDGRFGSPSDRRAALDDLYGVDMETPTP